MRRLGINGGKLRKQLANPGTPGNMAVKMVAYTVCMCVRAGVNLGRAGEVGAGSE